MASIFVAISVILSGSVLSIRLLVLVISILVVSILVLCFYMQKEPPLPI
ncbi:MAG: hypothetical protein RR295_06000 [Oscillospiraceae bacterium]